MSGWYVSQLSVLNQRLVELNGKVNISFEFFPPRTLKMEQILWKSIDILSKLRPKFVSVTSGVSLGKIEGTNRVIKKIKERTGLITAPHLTCINRTRAELTEIAQNYWNNGIRHIIALRGDLPIGNNNPAMYGADLVALLKTIGDFDISVAAYPEVHPEAKNAQSDLINLKRKIDAGASRAITQFFFEVENYLRFRDRCVAVGIDVEIIPGILPVLNLTQITKFTTMSNVHIPGWMKILFSNLENHSEINQIIGANLAIDMVKILSSEGVNDFHFYTLNRSEIIYAICHFLGVRAKSDI
ncbi:MAG: methylenetetrahydrofolate reductase [Candidatus Dasytiphilus stammeri]